MGKMEEEANMKEEKKEKSEKEKVLNVISYMTGAEGSLPGHC